MNLNSVFQVYSPQPHVFVFVAVVGLAVPRTPASVHPGGPILPAAPLSAPSPARTVAPVPLQTSARVPSGSTCSTPVCSGGCNNGGTCTNEHTCQCSADWSGSTCDTPVCSLTCLNGGACNAQHTCSCVYGWSGSQCSVPVCNPACAAGLTCVAPNSCQCQNGYTVRLLSIVVGLNFARFWSGPGL